MLSTRQAFMCSDREYESNINKYRIENNFTWNDLNQLVGKGSSALRTLNNGLGSPIYLKGNKTGKIKDIVYKLMEIFDVQFEELFPRYVCKIYGDIDIVSLSDIANETHVDDVEFNVLLIQMEKYFKNLGKEHSFKLMYRNVFLGTSIQTLSQDYNQSVTKVRYLIQHAFDIIRCKKFIRNL